MSKLTPEAFDYHIAGHTYEEVAEKFGCSKRAVVAYAKKEHWRDRFKEIVRAARARSDRKATETIAAMSTRHLKTLKFVQAKAIEALRTLPISSAGEAIRALDMAIKSERVIRGEPGERTAVQPGVLVVPAQKTPKQWIAEQTALNATRVAPQ